MHAPLQPGIRAGRQRRPPAAEYDDGESGATAPKESVGATANGRKEATAPGREGEKAGTAKRGSLLVIGSHVGRRQQNHCATSFLRPDLKAGRQAM